jgi:PAT family beta-lactamase induction signal transducer AmpG
MFAGAQVGAAIGGSGVLFLKGVVGFSAASMVVPLLLAGIMAMVIFLMIEGNHTRLGVDGKAAPKRAAVEVFREAGGYLVDVVKVFFGTKRGFLGLLVAVVPTGGMALSLTVSTVLTPTLGMTDKEIAALGLVSSLVFTVCCMTGGFLSDRFGRRLTLALFALGTLVPTLWMAWRLGGEGWTMPLPASADGSWPRQEVLIKAWWIAAIAYSVFNGLLYGIRTALFMDIVEPKIAATQFTACMALLNLVTIYCYWWQGKAVTPVADGGWGLSYQSIFLIDAALGTVFIFILPFLKPRNVEERAEVGVVGNEVI